MTSTLACVIDAAILVDSDAGAEQVPHILRPPAAPTLIGGAPAQSPTSHAAFRQRHQRLAKRPVGQEIRRGQPHGLVSAFVSN